ncbi:hypothetical protein ACG0Z6_12075 [Roseateles sp. BYS180W]|uniref:Uncharacterized protein n=1 Tax=Roseateles rivi TaxID=3299028 RepID=A0ABW7FXB3_9BURK
MTYIKRLIIYKLIFRLLILFLCAPIQSYSQALPKFNPSNVTRSVSGVMQDGMRARGFAANDPRFMATLSSSSAVIGGVAGTTAAAIVVGTVTAPAWASVALAAGVGAVVTYGVTLGVEGLVAWLFGSDAIDVTQNNSNAPVSGLVLGGAYWSTGGTSGVIYGGDGIAVAREGYGQWANRWGIENSPSCELIAGNSIAKCVATVPDPVTGAYAVRQALLYKSGAPSSCSTGYFFLENSGCKPYTPPKDMNIARATPQQAISALPQSELEKPLNPAIVAALANRAWQQAASQQGYSGLPYPQSNPITDSEVKKWIQTNPSFAPRVGDFVSPNPATNAQQSPWALPLNPSQPSTAPVTGSNPNVTNPASQNPLTNLGPDPGIGAPAIETTPSAQQILDPVLNMLPGHRSFTASSQVGTCPTPTINLYGSHVMDAHCILIDQNKGVIQGVMTFAWSVIALFIILSA